MKKTKIALWVKALRDHTGLSQMAFSKHIGVKYRTFQEWERGTKNPSSPSIALLKRIEREQEEPS